MCTPQAKALKVPEQQAEGQWFSGAGCLLPSLGSLHKDKSTCISCAYFQELLASNLPSQFLRVTKICFTQTKFGPLLELPEALIWRFSKSSCQGSWATPSPAEPQSILCSEQLIRIPAVFCLVVPYELSIPLLLK